MKTIDVDSYAFILDQLIQERETVKDKAMDELKRYVEEHYEGEQGLAETQLT